MSDLNLTNIIASYGYIAILLFMFLEGMCIPIPSEFTMGFAGFLAYQGNLSLPEAILAGWLGSFAGSFSIYLLARKGGRKFLYSRGHLIHLGPERLDTIGVWFNRYGPPLIIPWRQLPIIRTKISIAAGLLDMRYIVFTIYTSLGIAIWCTLAASLGYYFGRNWELLVSFFSALGYYVVIAIVIAAFALVFFYYSRKRKLQKSLR